MSNIELFEAWVSATQALAEAKRIELELRNKIAPLVLDGKVEGSKTATIDDWKFTAQGVLNYNLDKTAVKEIWEDLTDDELSCIEWVMELKVPPYRKLPKDAKLRSVVTVKPGQAQLSLKA